MRKRAGAAILAASLAYGVLPASAYTDLFAFGDSLSDAGNHFQATGSPPAPYFMGHASNGPTWVEDLSLQLNLGSLTPSLLGGNDFAFAGGQSGKTDANPNFLRGTTTPNPIRMFDLDAQIAAYHNAHPDPVPGAGRTCSQPGAVRRRVHRARVQRAPVDRTGIFLRAGDPPPHAAGERAGTAE